MALCAREVSPSEVTMPGRLLPAMLQRVQPKVSELLRLRMGEDRHHAAFLTKFVGISISL